MFSVILFVGSYEVVFYDGFKKVIQPINIKVMDPEVQEEVSTNILCLAEMSFNDTSRRWLSFGSRLKISFMSIKSIIPNHDD